MAKVQGTCDARFKEVEKVLQGFLDSGDELGLSFVVNIDGEDVVDLWGGYADQAKTREWEKDTITTVWSTSKTIVSLAVLMLIDRGLISPYDKVSKHWPEFGANGKEDIEVRRLISHMSGVSGWDSDMAIEDLYDLPKSTALLAKQAPWWTPGTQSGYHSITMGHLNGELVRRVTGKTLGEFIADEIAAPLAADFRLGAKEEDWSRVAEIIPPPALGAPPPGVMDPGSVAMKTLGNPPMDASVANTDAWRRAEVPAANGHANARGVVRMLSAIANGGQVGGTKLLSPKTIDLIFEEQFKGTDLVLGKQIRLGIGYGLSWKESIASWLPEGRLCFWGGWGGSLGIVDVDRKVTISFVMNKMAMSAFGSDCGKAAVAAVYKAIGV
ncbi:Beta-lactamase [Neofusicoccum parvum]|uniref:Beta-lactamase n=1 Tax=Neofusicoccum parvum TaxID=310453 RepID=A0ACB5SFU0_9PEZI|nr:Beta-lactamase [Neofusicoccum parvum]